MSTPRIIDTTDTNDLIQCFAPDVAAGILRRSTPEALAKLKAWLPDTGRIYLKCERQSADDMCASISQKLGSQQSSLLAADMCRLVHFYAQLTGHKLLSCEFRSASARQFMRNRDPAFLRELQKIETFHYDGPGRALRLLTNYQGKGTEYLPPELGYTSDLFGQYLDDKQYQEQDTQCVQATDVVLLKGKDYPDDAALSPRLYHRGPQMLMSDPVRYIFIIDPAGGDTQSEENDKIFKQEISNLRQKQTQFRKTALASKAKLPALSL